MAATPQAEGAPWPGLLFLFLLAAGVLAPHDVWRPLRPKDTHASTSVKDPAAGVRARQWEDPLGLAEPGRRCGNTSSLPPGCEKTDLALGVLLHGGESPDEVESRMRTRHAVHAAFVSAGYVATSDRMRFCSQKGEAGSTDVPYEMLESKRDSPLTESQARYGRVALVWLDEGRLNRAPVTRFREMVSCWKVDEMALLGPVSSESLADVLGDLTCPENERVRVFSPWATASVDKREQSSHFKRTIATDARVATELVAELGRRAISNAHGKRVLLAVQRDSKFAREWARLFKELYGPGVTVTTFAAGLDGIPLGTPLPKDRDAGRLEEDRQTRAAENRDRPFGRQTLDHLRRLQNRIRFEGLRYDAVGVFAADVYDKIAVLRALRPVLSGAVFFTSDLDARLAHQSVQHVTRNLVVVSGFGLEDERSAKLHPPFRDAYQLSTYRATYEALDPFDSRGHDSDCEVHTFEIAKSGPWPLDAIREGWTKDLLLFATVLIGAGLALVQLLLRPRELCSAFRCGPTGTWRSRRLLTCVLAAVPLLGCVALVASASSPSGEPFALFEGISVWPTELIRLLSYVLAVIFGIVAVQRLTLIKERIARDYGLPVSPSYTMESRTDRFSVLGAKLKDAFGVGRPIGTDLETLKGVWMLFDWKTSPGRRVRRALVCAVVFMACGMTFISVFGLPNRPARGAIAVTADWAVMILSVGSMLWLLALVAFDCALVMWLIAAVRRVVWPKADREIAGETVRRQFLLVRNLGDQVASTIYFPFTVMLVLILSRNGIFDDWHWPRGLLIVVATALLVVLFVTLGMSRRARDFRALLEDRLADGRRHILAGKQSLRRAELLKDVLESLKSTTGGVFAPVGSHPIVRALLIPTTGIGGLTLIEWART